uniref:Gfo/Idh/MocA-like oxidoreductase N-terminal domain-containing protein n=1 Tax=Trichogramma kaykai TaxID=54128 RepID=A0ABD2X536_9HYME
MMVQVSILVAGLLRAYTNFCASRKPDDAASFAAGNDIPGAAADAGDAALRTASGALHSAAVLDLFLAAGEPDELLQSRGQCSRHRHDSSAGHHRRRASNVSCPDFARFRQSSLDRSWPPSSSRRRRRTRSRNPCQRPRIICTPSKYCQKKKKKKKKSIQAPKSNRSRRYENDCALKSDGKRRDPVLGVAIFGLGRAGTIHLSNLVNNPRVKLLYVVDDTESKWKDLKEYWRLDDIPVIGSKQADRVYNDPKVDAVVVCSPTYTHEGIVTRALGAKKAVFCEKPIAEQPASTAKCYEAARRASRPLFCAFNRRFDPSYRDVYERLRRGEIGQAHIMRLTARDSPLPTIDYLRTSGGIFHDCMVHDIDLLTWMLGEYPIRVSVHASAMIPEIKAIDDFDTVAAVFHFPSGTVGMVDLSRNSCYGYDQRIEVFGPKGLIDATNEQPIHCVTAQLGQQGQRKPPIWYSFASRFRNAYAREMEHFLDVALGKAQPLVQEKEIMAVSKIADACEKSARTGQSQELKWAADELPNHR